MESIIELRGICRKKHKKGVTKPHWWATLFARRISIYFTWLIVHYSKISANQITIWQLIASLIGLGLLCFSDVWIAFFGTLFLHLGYIFDNVDGEVARYRKSMSINGMFLDFVNHEVIIPMTFGCLAFHYYFKTNMIVFFILGIVIILCKINPVGKARQTTIDYLIQKRNSPSYDIRTYSRENDEKMHISDKSFELSKSKFKFLINKFRKMIMHVFEYPNDVILISLIILFELITDISLVGEYFIPIYAAYLVGNFASDIYIHLRNNVPERDFHSYLLAVIEIEQNHKIKKLNT